MSKASEFFLRSKSDVVLLELVEISHPAFSKTYRVVRNAYDGCTVKHIDGEYYYYEYFPLHIDDGGFSDDLDRVLKIAIGDLGTVVPGELDLVRNSDQFNIKPTVIYSVYGSDNLGVPLINPVVLEADNFTFTKDGCQFEARTPMINSSKTGEFFTLDRFPMQRGFM